MLSAFAKAGDLTYFLNRLANIQYLHEPLLAPNDEMLRKYKKLGGNWEDYTKEFIELMVSRRIEEKLDSTMFDFSCLLCSEAKPHHCHRRLVCEYLNSKWDRKLTVKHL